MSQVFIHANYVSRMKSLISMVIESKIDTSSDAYNKMLEQCGITYYEWANFYNPESCCYNHAFPSKDKILDEIKTKDMYDNLIKKMQITVDYYLENPEKLNG